MGCHESDKKLTVYFEAINQIGHALPKADYKLWKRNRNGSYNFIVSCTVVRSTSS